MIRISDEKAEIIGSIEDFKKIDCHTGELFEQYNLREEKEDEKFKKENKRITDNCDFE